MKKGIFILLAIIIAVFVLHGCHSDQTTLRKGAQSGYPVGHDMHPDTNKDEDDKMGGLGNYS